MSQRLHLRFATLAVMALALSLRAAGQGAQAAEPQPANLVGTVTDVNGDTVPNATVMLEGPDRHDQRTIVTGASGFFQFEQVRAGIPYQIRISAKDFADWISPALTLGPGEYKIVSNIQLRLEAEHIAVQVNYDPGKVATEQFKAEVGQRTFGFIPNFYVAYDPSAEPLTKKMKFTLALKVATDPVTIAGVFVVAGAKQAGNSPRYGQGWGAYGERFGATAADGLTDIMIGGAILPSILHHDPRYFYQGTGTTGSRIRHAMLSPFWSRNDSGKYGPNYSSLGGDLASSALSNLYYPKANRGAGLVFGNFAIGTAERIGASLAQELLLAKFTRRGGHVQ